ncbi:MAG: Plug domain-containing protein, partial [Bacteroidales bacterium]|nr:Plug domain-containing protein [Bacteroidales bacterium]
MSYTILADRQEDTIAQYSIEGLWVVDSPKESRVLRNQPVSSSIVQRKALEDSRVFSMKNLTGLVPNLYIPDYGTKYTSSIYIRGIGSRINSPAVGIYVDGIPMFDKSGFDFDYSDIERVEVLRGPQGTLYGRNTMGGLINIKTKN